MNGVRLYFETTDPIGEVVKCYGDYQRQFIALTNEVGSEYVETIAVTDWGMLEGFNRGTRKIQPYWLLAVVESKKSEIIFGDYQGRFNEYPVVK